MFDHIEYMALVREHWDSIAAIKAFGLFWKPGDELEENAHWLVRVHEAWSEIPEEDQKELWRAQSKGGVFTTDERKQIREAASLWHQATRSE